VLFDSEVPKVEETNRHEYTKG